MPSSNQPGDIWQALFDELDRWQAAGKTATLWWRDDDAIQYTPQLEKLEALCLDYNVPVSIAVIPALLEDSLVDYLATRQSFTVLQHGYTHLSHAAAGQKKIEIGGMREPEEIEAELRAGRKRLQDAFAEQFVAVLVPPWNRFDKSCYSMLNRLDLVGISSMWARQQAHPTQNVLQVNCHLDPVNWRQGRGFIDEHAAIDHIHLHLLSRRTGIVDSDEPTGILTHHLVQTDDVWNFCQRLLSRLSEHPAVRWLDAKTIWQ